MQILDLSKVRKLVVQVLLASFFVYVRDDDDPAFDRADGGCIGVGGHREVFRVMSVIGFGGEGRIDFHFGVCHDDGIGLKGEEGVGVVLLWQERRWICVAWFLSRLFFSRGCFQGPPLSSYPSALSLDVATTLIRNMMP